MKKFFLVFLSVVFLSCSKENNNGKIRFKSESVESAHHFAKKELKRYTSEKYTILIDSLENTSGFLGWRNLRDYVHLGEETMKAKVTRIWSGVYNLDEVSTILNYHLNGIRNQNGITNDIQHKVVVKEYSYVSNYAHKIGISFIVLVLEIFIEGILSFWIAYLIGFCVMYFFNRDISQSIVVLLLITFLLFISFVIISIFTQNLSQEKLKNYLVKETVISSMADFDKQLLIIDNLKKK